MFTLFTLKAVITAVTLAIMLGAVFLTLRLADKLLGVSFGLMFTEIRSSPVALAVYLGCRLIGVFIACAVVLCLAFLF